MSEQKPKLPTGIVIMNVIMIILIIIICILTFSLAYSNANNAKPSQSNNTSSGDLLSDTSSDISGELIPAATTTTHHSVTMTKRTTEPTEATEPIEVVITTPEESDSSVPEQGETSNEQHSTNYSKDFFKDDLFIGDSIATGLYAYNKLDMKNVAAGIGYTPYKAYTKEIDLYDGSSATAFDYAVAMQPKRIFIMLGSNGLTSAAAMEDSYRTLIDKLQEGCPSSTIYLISVTPVTVDSSAAASSGITNQMVIDFNTYIKSLSIEYGLKYLDTYTLVIDSNGWFRQDYAEADGLHFMGATYDVMLSYIQTELS